ncbi:hypothetical protein BDR06DRAFT_977266 [Suillus hirtellus]|nr:hypothetical protein BDR06DRAFT_977266 [Suillus hirtellus]
MTPEPSDISETSIHFQDLLKELNSGVRGSCKRKFCGPIEPYIHAARWFPLAIDPFSVLENVLYKGMEAEFSELRANTSDQSEEASGLNNRQKELCIKQYKELVKLVPTFSNIISGFEKVPSAMDNFIHALTCAANDARSDDTGSLMREGLLYMLKNPETDRFDPPLLRQHGKIVHGWNHPQTARLLCLMRMLDVFDKNPHYRDFMDKVNQGQITITVAKLPTYLYDESMLDLTRKNRGCLRGYYLKRLLPHIHWTIKCYFCNCSQRHKGSKRSNSQYDIATTMSNCIRSRTVDMFKGDSTNKQWVQETLNHWKSETPGLLQCGRSRARIDAGLHAFESEDDMDDFFESDEHFLNSREQGSQDSTKNSGNAGNMHAHHSNVDTYIGSSPISVLCICFSVSVTLFLESSKCKCGVEGVLSSEHSYPVILLYRFQISEAIEQYEKSWAQGACQV